jgi:hypothetical protein
MATVLRNLIYRIIFVGSFFAVQVEKCSASEKIEEQKTDWSLIPNEIAQHIVSFLRYDLQRFHCLQQSSKYWKEICDGEQISLRVLENIRKQNYKLPEDYHDEELDLYKQRMLSTLPKHRNFFKLVGRYKHPYDLMRNFPVTVEDNLKPPEDDNLELEQWIIKIKDPLDNNREKKYLFCDSLDFGKERISSILKPMSDGDIESIFLQSWPSNEKILQLYVNSLLSYITDIITDINRHEHEKTALIKKMVNVIDFDGATILHKLCRYWYSSVWKISEQAMLIQQLIENGAEINRSDYKENIPLNEAIDVSYILSRDISYKSDWFNNIIKLLLQRGAKTDLNRDYGKRLPRWARANQLPDAPEFLKIVEESCDPVLLKEFDDQGQTV